MESKPVERNKVAASSISQRSQADSDKGTLQKKNKNQDVNILHRVRSKEKDIKKNFLNSVLEERNRSIERKRLSSAFSSTKTSASIPVTASLKSKINIMEQQRPESSDSSTFDRFHYISVGNSLVEKSTGKKTTRTEDEESGTSVTIMEGTKAKFGPGGKRRGKESSYFVPSLVELCAKCIAENFEDHPSLEGLSNELIACVTEKLSVQIPLQISVPIVSDDAYWKRCCSMRWSDGQLGSFAKIVKYDYIDESDFPQSQSKTWKQLYLERNLQEFLENMQSNESIAQELHVLSQQPEIKKRVTSSTATELQTLLKMKEINREKMLQNLSSEECEKSLREIETNGKMSVSSSVPSEVQEGKKIFETLHSHTMRPNLNYYLLHDHSEFNNASLSVFREKLKDLYDGNESINTSRLNNLTTDDDIFTFYDNAIHKHYYKAMNQRDTSQPTLPSTQYWLLAKREKVDENPDVIAMLNYVKERNMRKLVLLGDLSAEHVTELEIKSLRSHIDLQALFEKLPKLQTLKLQYGVMNAGMSFDMSMFGMKANDCKHLSEALQDTALTKNLHTLLLAENMIDDDILLGLLKGLTNNNRIIHLDLSHNKISKNGGRSLGAYIRQSTSLKYINLCDNLLRSEGARFIALALKSNNSLKYINLRMNRLEDEGGKQLVIIGLHHNDKLERIDLSSNELGIDSATVLGNLVVAQSKKETACKIKHFDLSGNPFSKEGGKLLLSSLQQNSTILEFDVRHTDIGRQDTIKIEEKIQQNKNALDPSLTKFIEEQLSKPNLHPPITPNTDNSSITSSSQKNQ